MKSWPIIEQHQRTVQCVVHGNINLHDPLQHIIDTPEFQRLRDLKQMGMVYTVYPSAVHNRFVHSLGVYHLANQFCQHLRTRQPELNITSEDHLCVCIAALCHDIGHGPFSHLFDSAYMAVTGGKKWKHEMASVQLIRRLFYEPSIKEVLTEYLGDGERYEQNLTFIQEIISSDKFGSDGQWLPKGRGIEKSFLFDIVSNDHDAIDVDKLDYLLRDSASVGIGIHLNTTSVERMIMNSRVLEDPERPGLPRICYALKTQNVLKSVGDARQDLHDSLYQHKTVRVIEVWVVRALVCAEQYLKFRGDNGNQYPLSMVVEDMGAYIKTTDSILRQIVNSSEPELEDARKLLDDVERRRIPLFLTDATCSRSNTDQKMIKEKLTEKLGSSFEDEDILLLTRDLNRGLDGKTNPMEKVLLFDKTGPQPMRVDPQWLRLKAPLESGIKTISVYVSRSMNQEKRDRVLKAFHSILIELGLREDENTQSSTSTVTNG